MKDRLSKRVGATLVVSLLMCALGGCVGEAVDEEEPLGESTQGVTLEPTPKALSIQHPDPAPPPQSAPTLPTPSSQGSPDDEPEPNPWDVGDNAPPGASNGNGSPGQTH